MQYQILPTNIIRIVWQTVRRITNEILEKKEFVHLTTQMVLPAGLAF